LSGKNLRIKLKGFISKTEKVEGFLR